MVFTKPGLVDDTYRLSYFLIISSIYNNEIPKSIILTVNGSALDKNNIDSGF